MALLTRRAAFRAGFSATASLALPNILRCRASAAEKGSSAADTSVIFVQLGGGPPQHETYDPKPDAPAEYRGAFSPIATTLPGVAFSELMPRQAALMKHLAVVRSITHHEASHIALHAVETGYFLQVPGNSRRGEMPCVGSIVSRARGPGPDKLPAYISLPTMSAYSHPHYLGGQHSAFNVDADPNAPEFRIPNLSLAKGLTSDRLGERRTLLRSFDRSGSIPDAGGASDALDSFQQQALDLMTGRKVQEAFDLSREAEALRDRYGRNSFGQRLILARRLAGAGVPFVAVRTFDWDDHANLAANMKKRGPMYDAGMAALVQDLLDKGLNRRILVVAMGEFGRTPRVNPNGGRDHWPAAQSVLLAGGELEMGRVVGATDGAGGTAVRSPYAPQNVLAVVYRHLGIDPATAHPDFSGRPRALLEEQKPIDELL